MRRLLIPIVLSVSAAFAQDFTLSMSSTTFSIEQGSSNEFPLGAVVTPSGGFQGQVTFEILPGLPSGTAVQFLPNPMFIQLVSGPSVDIVLAKNAPLGTYTASVRATSGNLVRTTSFTLQVIPRKDFILSVDAFEKSVVLGSIVTWRVGITSVNGFSQPVTISSADIGQFIAKGPSPTVTPPPNGTVYAEISYFVGAQQGTGTVNFEIIGFSNGPSIRSNPIAVRMVIVGPGSFDAVLASSTTSILPGQAARYSIQLRSIGNFSGPVRVQCVNLPPSFSCPSVQANLLPGSLATVEISVTPPSSFRGPATFALVATGGAPQKEILAGLFVLEPVSPTLALSGTRSIRRGESAVFEGAVQGNSTSTIRFSVTGLPEGASAVVTPEQVSSFSTAFPIVLTITTANTVSTGTFPITLRGTGQGGLEFSASVSLVILPTAELIVSAVETSKTARAGTAATFQIQLASRNGYSGQVVIQALGIPPAIGTASITPATATLSEGSSLSITVSVEVSRSAPLGTIPFELAIRATGQKDLKVGLSLAVVLAPPRISPGGVVDAANYQRRGAPGGIGSVFGGDFAPTFTRALTVPLPTTLGGMRVMVDGIPAPLFAVAPTQINFQFPFATAVGRSARVVVERDGVPSEAVEIEMASYAPAIFEYEARPGKLGPIVTYADGSLVSAEKPATNGDILVVYGTGVGMLSEAVSSGHPSPVPPAASVVLPEILLGTQPIEVLFAGLTPGSIGLAQFNVRVGAIAEGVSELPLTIRYGAVSSKPLLLPVRFQPRP